MGMSRGGGGGGGGGGEGDVWVWDRFLVVVFLSCRNICDYFLVINFVEQVPFH